MMIVIDIWLRTTEIICEDCYVRNILMRNTLSGGVTKAVVCVILSVGLCI